MQIPLHRCGMALVASLLVPLPTPASAGGLESLTVHKDAGVYHVHAVMQVAAPPHRVYRLLTDYDRLDRINPAIRSSRRLQSTASGPQRVELQSTQCVLWYCRSLHQVQEVMESGDGIIVVTDLAGHSDFKSMNTRWEVIAHEDGTRVSYRSELVPGFWLPPLLGTTLIKRSLHDTALATIDRLEQTAPHSP